MNRIKNFLAIFIVFTVVIMGYSVVTVCADVLDENINTSDEVTVIQEDNLTIDEIIEKYGFTVEEEITGETDMTPQVSAHQGGKKRAPMWSKYMGNIECSYGLYPVDNYFTIICHAEAKGGVPDWINMHCSIYNGNRNITTEDKYSPNSLSTSLIMHANKIGLKNNKITSAEASYVFAKYGYSPVTAKKSWRK